MELVKSKGMVVFLIIIMFTTFIGAINNKYNNDYEKSLQTNSDSNQIVMKK